MKKIAFLIAMIVFFTNFWNISPTISSNNFLKVPLKQIMDEFQKNNNQLPEKYQAPYSPRKSIKGKNNIMVGLFQFSDSKPKLVPETLIEKFDNPTSRCLRHYYEMLSNGETKLDFGTVGIKNEWMMMPKPIADYKTLDELFYDANNVMQKNNYDFSEFDNDGNGVPDLIIYIWAGNSWTLGGSVPGDFMRPGEKGNIICLGEDVYYGSGFSLITLLHEFFHGFYNLYDLYDYSGKIRNVVGGWDLMGEGVWQGYCGLSSFHRWKAGWVEMETITEPGVYEINDLNTDSSHRAYKIPIPGAEGEWILLENRQRHGGDGYFQGCPSNGIVLYHVDDSRAYAHRFNTQSKENPNPGIRVIDTGGGGGLLKDAQMGKDLGREKLTGSSIPNTLPYKPTLGSKTISITDVSVVGPKMTFRLSYDEPQVPLVVVSETIDFGKIEKGKTSTMKLNFKNAGKGKLRLMIKALNPWISFDRTSFIGVDEDIFVTVDTAKLDFGLQEGKITFGGESLDKNGYIKVILKVVPKLGDMNADGSVDSLDFEMFTKSFGKSVQEPGFDDRADLNEDLRVDMNDLFIFAKNYEKNKN